MKVCSCQRIAIEGYANGRTTWVGDRDTGCDRISHMHRAKILDGIVYSNGRSWATGSMQWDTYMSTTTIQCDEKRGSIFYFLSRIESYRECPLGPKCPGIVYDGKSNPGNRSRGNID